ncbi:DUF397 domain-containing protein [Actinomadura sediminis]|uniref:DUF397 domain-containing protein n=1 Tax=Actinomadura sediminis TaxID=1038904 RepID=A0ABW3ERB5_9ACTN
MDLSNVAWRKASRSHDDGDQCIEVASIGETMLVRDSKDPDGPKVTLARSEFRHFAAAIKRL